MRRLHVQRLLLCCALLLLPNARALWFSMPPECDGRCWEEDVKHPLASCDLEVVEGAITPEEADDVVAAAEAHAAVHGWHSQRHIAYPTQDLPWTALPSVARVFDKLWGAMEESVRRRCGVRPIDRLTPNDIFAVKYTPEGQAGLDRHRDASTFSFNAALSDPTVHRQTQNKLCNNVLKLANSGKGAVVRDIIFLAWRGWHRARWAQDYRSGEPLLAQAVQGLRGTDTDARALAVFAQQLEATRRCAAAAIPTPRDELARWSRESLCA